MNNNAPDTVLPVTGHDARLARLAMLPAWARKGLAPAAIAYLGAVEAGGVTPRTAADLARTAEALDASMRAAGVRDTLSRSWGAVQGVRRLYAPV